jgi:KDO2-lipid IV(A) lauroyltransferase
MVYFPSICPSIEEIANPAAAGARISRIFLQKDAAVTGSTDNLYHPRYWLSWLAIGLLKLLTLLPFGFQLWLGRVIGRLFLLVGRHRRHIAEVNLRLCFPELDVQQRKDLLRRTFESQGMGLMETAAAWLMPLERLQPLADIFGVELIQRAQEQGKPVLLLGAHYTTLDIAGTLFGHAQQMDVIFRRQKNPIINHMMDEGRAKYLQGGRTIAQDDMRGVYRSLLEKRVLWYPPDQDYGAKHSVFAPFFGIPAAVIKAPTRMASKSKATVLACWYYRTEAGRYHIEIGEIEGFTGEDFYTDAVAINKKLESIIRQHPEQYMWVHRRFKSRPPGMPKVY